MFVGMWKNVDPNTRDMPQLQVRIDGDTIYVHGYGACVPTFCDWGEASVPSSAISAGTFTVNWTFPAPVGISDTLTMTLSTANGPLETVLASNDTSGRTFPTVHDTFTKSQ
jgi:hypothetical protein